MLLLIFGANDIHAQDATTATGGDASGIGGTSSYSVGQLVYTTNIGTNGSVAQGIQQPYEIFVTIGIEVAEISLELSASPNPTISFLNLRIGNYNREKLAYKLYDLQGRLLEYNQLTSNSTTITMEGLGPSTYLLNVMDETSLVKTFKIIKN